MKIINIEDDIINTVKSNKYTCPVCGSRKFTIGEHCTLITSLKGTALPVTPLICQECRHIDFFLNKIEE